MVEMLAIFGFIAWLCASFSHWVSSLSFFPALIVATVTIPGVTVFNYRRQVRQWKMTGAFDCREPVPPERFYWSIQKPLLRRSMLWFSIVTLCAWWNVSELFRVDSFDINTVFGWLNLIAAIVSTGRAMSACILYFRASQWFDCMTPDVVRILRQAMYRLSDNYEYLGQRKRDPVKEEVY